MEGDYSSGSRINIPDACFGTDISGGSYDFRVSPGAWGGGFMGKCEDVIMENAVFTNFGQIGGDPDDKYDDCHTIGGLFGTIYRSNLSNSQFINRGEVNGNDNVGGVAGCLNLKYSEHLGTNVKFENHHEINTRVKDLFCVGNAVGGVIGDLMYYFHEGSEIEYYPTLTLINNANVEGDCFVGGLIGSANGAIKISPESGVGLNNSSVVISGTSRVGGVYGHLHIEEDHTYNPVNYDLPINATLRGVDDKETSIGGVVGYLRIQENLKFQIKLNKKSNIHISDYHSGAGIVIGESYLFSGAELSVSTFDNIAKNSIRTSGIGYDAGGMIGLCSYNRYTCDPCQNAKIFLNDSHLNIDVTGKGCGALVGTHYTGTEIIISNAYNNGVLTPQ